MPTPATQDPTPSPIPESPEMGMDDVHNCGALSSGDQVANVVYLCDLNLDGRFPCEDGSTRLVYSDNERITGPFETTSNPEFLCQGSDKPPVLKTPPDNARATTDACDIPIIGPIGCALTNTR